MTSDEPLYKTILRGIPPLHPEGPKFVAAFAVVSLVLGFIWDPLAEVGLVLTVWCAYFFRDPVRSVPTREGLIVSPADGIVQKIVKVVPSPSLGLGSEERLRISIFLNVFNVHVNRIPIKGTITALHYHPGAFFNASLDKASEENERQYVGITLANGQTIGVVQIAGLIARRILCTLSYDQQVATGERFGLIRFGSRVDVYLPHGVEPLVTVGQVATGGETILADLTSTEIRRIGTPI